MTTRISTDPVTVPVVTATASGVRVNCDGNVFFIAHADSTKLAAWIRGALADAYLAGKYSSHQEGPTA